MMRTRFLCSTILFLLPLCVVVVGCGQNRIATTPQPASPLANASFLCTLSTTTTGPNQVISGGGGWSDRHMHVDGGQPSHGCDFSVF